MATENLREKLNALNNWIVSEDVQVFQHEMLIEAAKESTGDKQVDSQMKTMAQNAKSVCLASGMRLKVYRKNLSALEKELEKEEAAKKEPAA